MYLDAFANHVGRRLVEIDIVKEVGIPSTVMERCIEKKAELESIASRRGANSFEKNFSVWAVFDRDDHGCYYDSIKKGKERGIFVAYSNPCIELWAFLHLENHGTRPISRQEIQRNLKRVMPQYDHSRSAVFDFDQIKERYSFARDQAIQLANSCCNLGDPYGVPVTSMYELTDLIMISANPPAERREKAEALKTRINEIESDPLYITGNPQLARERSRILTSLREITTV